MLDCKMPIREQPALRTLDEWELPEEFHQVGREYFARAPGSDIWVRFSDLPDTVRERLWEKQGMPVGAVEVANIPF
jgi:hypothetical protein